jgi:hypothetical protein
MISSKLYTGSSSETGGQNADWPNTNHPDKEHNDDDEDNRSSNATSYVGKLRLLLAVLPRETTDAAARWLSSGVFHAGTFIVTVPCTYICEQWKSYIIPDINIQQTF